MKIWITKYALSKRGIFEAEVNQSDALPDMVVRKGRYGYIETYRGDDWHRTEAAALVRAEDMRVKKTDALRRQIAKLEAMKFG